MSKPSAILAVLCVAAAAAALLAALPLATGLTASAQAPAGDLPPGPMQVKARAACLPCHTAAIIVQQQLDLRMWTKEVDKMIRWGAPVIAEDRQALIDYFARNFGPRQEPPAEVALPAGRGAGKARAACLSCHNAGIIVQQQLDRRAWARLLDKMILWGAPVRAPDRDAILNYLSAHFSPAPQDTQEEKRK